MNKNESIDLTQIAGRNTSAIELSKYICAGSLSYSGQLVIQRSLEDIPRLLCDLEAKDKRIAELEETEKLLKEIASELAGTDRMACLSCSNHMKKLHGEHQRCDGNCEHKYGMPKNADEVIAWFKGD